MPEARDEGQGVRGLVIDWKGAEISYLGGPGPVEDYGNVHRLGR